MEEAERAKEEEVKKIRDEIEASTSAQINRALQAVESKISSSAGASSIEGIKSEFEALKKEMRKIQDRAVTEVEDAEKKRAISGMLGTLSVGEKAILRMIAEESGDVAEYGLGLQGYNISEIRRTIAKAGRLAERVIQIDKDGSEWVTYSLDQDLREALRK